MRALWEELLVRRLKLGQVYEPDHKGYPVLPATCKLPEPLESPLLTSTFGASAPDRGELWNQGASLVRIRALNSARAHGCHHVVVGEVLTGLDARVGIGRPGDQRRDFRIRPRRISPVHVVASDSGGRARGPG